MGSCIDKQRFKTRLNDTNLSSYLNLICQYKQPNLRTICWLLISDPRRLARMVKRHHMSGDSFIVFVILFTLALIHNNLKIAIHLIWVGYDPKRLQFTHDIYYASLTGSSINPAYWNMIYFSNITLNTVVWFRCLYDLLCESIINETNYKSISISQLNLAYLASFQAEPLSGVRNIARACKYRNQLAHKHRHHIDANTCINYEKQLKISDYWIEHVELKTFIANFNIIDFSESHKHLWSIYARSKTTPNPDTMTLIEPDPRWHMAEPRHRMDIGPMLSGIVLIHFILCIQIWGLAMYIILINLMEIYESERNTDDLWIPSRFCKLLRIRTIIRNVELIINAIATLRLHFIFFLLIWDSLILISRIKKVTSIAFDKVESIRCLDHPVSWKMKMNKEIYYEHKRGNHQFKETKHDRQMRYILLMSRVVYCEFNDLKRRHTKFINILLVGYSICLPQCLATLIVENTFVEKNILALFTLGVCLPLIFLLVFSAILELSVSN